MKQSLRQPYKQFFGTVANQHRLDIIEALQQKPLNVTLLSKKTGCNQTTISHNLRRLEHCGFVFAQQSGRERTYSLNKKTIQPLLTLMHKHMNYYCRRTIHEHKTNCQGHAL